MSLPIYSAENIRKWDQFTIQNEPVTSLDLMERAASSCTKQILARNIFDSAAIFCGTGNNGGDGLVIARLLHERGVKVKVFVLEISKDQSADFKKNLDRLPGGLDQISLSETISEFTVSEDLIIDAIFGSGLNKEPGGWIAQVIDRINASGKKVASVDIPSGLYCDDNRSNSLVHVIKANQTITFQSPKLSFLFADYAGFVGDLHIADIGLSEQFCEVPQATFFTRKDINLKQRKLFSHKGNHGYLLVVAGFQNYGGAAILASKAALKSGSGYVAVHAHPDTKSPLLSSVSECLWIDKLDAELPQKASAIAIGPGLGTDQMALGIFEKILKFNLPIVIDADAINLLASNRNLIDKIPVNSILTPHLGELKRLIGDYKSSEETLEKQVAFSKKYQIYIIQKGAFSKITCPSGEIFINSSGNPGMASAGMGDVLTGVIGALLAQGYDPKSAACYGTFLHGYAADLVKRKQGERGMIASDVIDQIPAALNSF